MKNHFIKLFNYDEFANKELLKAIINANDPNLPLQLMGHLLAAERRWMDRINDIEPYPFNLWPTDFTTAHCAKLITEYHDEWITIIKEFEVQDFDRVISYYNSVGEQYQTSISDILTHVINHGTHTRAQAGQQLKLSGAEKLPVTDYSFYLRQINS